MMEMKTLYGTMTYWGDSLGKKILGGKLMTAFVFFLIGMLILAFISLTVHNRTIRPQSLTDHTDEVTFQNWDRYGYWKCGGLHIFKVEFEKAYPYKSSFYGRTALYYGIHKVLSFLGVSNSRGFVIHFMPLFEVMLTAVLLALLAMKAGISWGLDQSSAFGIGLAVLIVYPCVPINLHAYFKVAESTTHALLMVAFLLTSEPLLLKRECSWPLLILRGGIVFYMFWVNYLLAAFFLGSYFLCWFFLWQRQGLPRKKENIQVFVFSYVIPFLLFLSIAAIQIMLVKSTFSNLEFVGGKFLFRSGLDGSSKYYQQFLISSESFLHYHAGTFYMSCAAFILLCLYSWKEDCKWLVFMVLMLASTFFIYAYIFSQALMVHQYLFRNLFVLPEIFLCFAVLPLLASKITRRAPIFSCITIFFAICYAFWCLRSYVMVYVPDDRLFGYF